MQRREQARLIDIENQKIAQKLVSVKGNAQLSKRRLENDFGKHQKAKANLCKLPIIDMTNRYHTNDLSTPKILRTSRSRPKIRHKKNLLSIEDGSTL